MTAAVHDHKRGYPIRRFAGRPGVFVQRHGDWDRPLHVWLYRGAWRVVCWPCMTALQSGNDLYSGGWATHAEAFRAAIGHCGGCPAGVEP